MASNDNSPPQTPTAPPNSRRRSSIAGLFQPRSSATTNTNAGTPAFPSTMQGRQNGPRRMSVSTSLGLSGSPNNSQNPPFNFPRRRDSISSSQASESPSQEYAVMEENEGSVPNSTPVTPFARRVSFGAQAFGNVRTGGGSFSNGTKNPSLSPLTEKSTNQSVSRSASTTTPPKSRGEGFNWGDNLRERSGRSVPGPAPNTGQANNPAPPVQHQRATSVATMEPPQQMKTTHAKPDHLGERMLRGDFMMD